MKTPMTSSSAFRYSASLVAVAFDGTHTDQPPPALWQTTFQRKTTHSLGIAPQSQPIGADTRHGPIDDRAAHPPDQGRSPRAVSPDSFACRNPLHSPTYGAQQAAGGIFAGIFRLFKATKWGNRRANYASSAAERGFSLGNQTFGGFIQPRACELREQTSIKPHHIRLQPRIGVQKYYNCTI